MKNTLLALLLVATACAQHNPSMSAQYTQFETIRRDLGSHYCDRKDPEHRHDAETYARINAGAIVLTPRVCHVEIRGKRKVYKYYIAAGEILADTFSDGEYRHDIVTWDESRKVGK